MIIVHRIFPETHKILLRVRLNHSGSNKIGTFDIIYSIYIAIYKQVFFLSITRKNEECELQS